MSSVTARLPNFYPELLANVPEGRMKTPKFRLPVDINGGYRERLTGQTETLKDRTESRTLTS